jgi:hypothetical protein
MTVNVESTTMLSQLYAKEMKHSKRGRILFVSSMVGAVPSGPGVATYAATKAYEKSLAQSMGRELEKYGVGVTCLIPGAVKDTSFAVDSNANEAICFKLPFYAMKAQHVASRGITSLLLSGDGEVIPGWHNRLFLKILMPILPPRLTSSIVAFAWSPLRLPWRVDSRIVVDDGMDDDISTNKQRNFESTQERISLMLDGMPPRVLELPSQATRKQKEAKIVREKQEDEIPIVIDNDNDNNNNNSNDNNDSNKEENSSGTELPFFIKTPGVEETQN